MMIKASIIMTCIVIFALILFGLKTCVLDHNKQLSAAMTWCKVKHLEHDNNQYVFIDSNKDYGSEYQLIIKRHSDGINTSLPARFIIKNDGTTECEITYCLKIGLSTCLYDYKNNNLILLSD